MTTGKRILRGLAIALTAVLAIPVVGMVRMHWHWMTKDASPADAIADRIGEDLGVALPEDSVVLQSERVPMGMDSAGAYELSLADAEGLVEAMQAAARAKGWDVDDGATAPFMHWPPAWWTPEAETRWVRLLWPERIVYNVGKATGGRLWIYWNTF